MILYPGTYVRLLSGVPLNNTYKDTLTFGSVSEQTSYFLSKVKISYDDFRYQPLDSPEPRTSGRISVPRIADDLYDVNYLMFRNNNFGEKWIYAFVTGIQFVNPSCTYITYEIDVMQTWKFNYTMLTSFVEREHTNNDAIGANLVPEGLEQGDYIMDEGVTPQEVSPLNSSIVIAATFDENMADAQSGIVGNIYSGLKFNVFSSVGAANAFIEKAVDANKSEGIVSIFMIPRTFANESVSPTTVQFSINKKTDNIDGYVPKNKKLFTAPYNILSVYNGTGNMATFQYEYFRTSECKFSIQGAMNCNPELLMMPVNYKYDGNEQLGMTNETQKFSLSGYPQCAYATDTYKVYLAQNAASLPVSMIGSAFTTASGAIGGAIKGAVGGAIAGPIGAIAGGIGGALMGGARGGFQIAEKLAQLKDISTLPPHAKGQSSNEASFAMLQTTYTFFHMFIRREFAEIIDNYFSMFGYATNRVKVPNVVGRKSWNYVKTINMELRGNIPVDDIAKIKTIFDNGVTFWHTDKVGDYTQDNSII